MASQLEEYNQKRDFEKTGEPEGKTEKTDNRLRFVVQHHSASRQRKRICLLVRLHVGSAAKALGVRVNSQDEANGIM